MSKQSCPDRWTRSLNHHRHVIGCLGRDVPALVAAHSQVTTVAAGGKRSGSDCLSVSPHWERSISTIRGCCSPGATRSAPSTGDPHSFQRARSSPWVGRRALSSTGDRSRNGSKDAVGSGRTGWIRWDTMDGSPWTSGTSKIRWEAWDGCHSPHNPEVEVLRRLVVRMPVQ
jgi:hypothetical protein